MFDLLIVSVVVLSGLGILSRTFLAFTKLILEDRRQQRLERFGEIPPSDSFVEEIVDAARSSFYPYQIGEKVLERLERRKLIPKSTVQFVRLGADKQRGVGK